MEKTDKRKIRNRFWIGKDSDGWKLVIWDDDGEERSKRFNAKFIMDFCVYNLKTKGYTELKDPL